MSATDPSALGQPSRGVALRRPSSRSGERAILAALLGCGLISILTTLAIVVSLFEGALEFFLEVSPIDYLTGTTWTPLFKDGQVGVLPLIRNPLEVVALASPVGLPPHLGVLVRCPLDATTTAALEVVYYRDGEQIARNVQPLASEPGKFNYRLVRAELAFDEPGTVEAHCRVDLGPATKVPYTVLAPL